MNNAGGALGFNVVVGQADFNKSFDQMGQRIQRFTNDSHKQITSLESDFSNLGRIAAGAFAFAGLSQLPAQILKVRGDFQQLEIAFGTMLGSKAKADALMKDVVKFAGTTPFDVKGVAQASKQLLAYGFESEKVIGVLRRLGDVSSGLNIPLGELTELYGKTKTNGRLFAEDLNQYVGRGIPLIKLLADQFKVAESEVRGLVETGKVGFPEVEKAILTLTNKGGMFAGLTLESSKALNGLVSNFEDAVDAMFNDLGRSQEGLIAETLRGGIAVVENYQQVLDVLKVLIATYGAYKATIIATSVLQAASGTAEAVQAWLSLATTIRTTKEAQIAFNLATSANPVSAAVAVIAALATAYAVYSDELTEAQKAEKLMTEARNKAEDAASSEIAKIQILLTSIRNENLSRDKRLGKLKELIALSPTHLNTLNLENIATDKGATAIDSYVAAMKRKIEAQEIDKGLTESIERQNKAKRGENKLGFLDNFLVAAQNTGSQFSTTAGQGYLSGIAKETKSFNQQIVQDEQKIQDGYKDRLKLLDEIDDKATKGGGASQEVIKKNITYYDQEIEKLKNLQKEKSLDNSAYATYQKKIDKFEKARARITGGKPEKIADKDLPKPFGSIEYYEQIARKAQEIIDITPASNTTLIAKQNAIKLAADERADEIRKSLSIKTFDEELEDKKSKYQLYQKWIESYTKEAADSQFSNLIKQGESFTSYLDGQIKSLEKQRDTPGIGLIGPEEEFLVKLKIEYDDATGAKSPLERLQEEIATVKENAGSLSEYLEILYTKQSKIGSGGGVNGEGQRKFIATEIVDVEKELQGVLRDFLRETASYTQKRLHIETDFNNLKKTANKKLSGEELKTAIKQIETQKKLELAAIADEEQEKSESYKRIHQEYLDYGRKQIKQRLEDIQKELKAEQISAQRRKELEVQLAKVKRELNTNTVAGVREAANLLNQVLGDVDLKLSKTFSIAMKDLSGAMSNISTLMDSEASTMDQIGSIIGLVSFVAVTVRDAFMKAEDLVTGMEGQESYYKGVAQEIEGVNILLERQKTILDGLRGGAKLEGSFNLIEKYGKQQEDALKGLKEMSIDVKSKQTEVFVDPILGTEIKNKGFAGVWTSLMTGGKAKTKIKYEFENVDTKGFDDIDDFINLLAEIKKGGGKINGKEVVAADLAALELYIKTYEEAEEAQKQLIEQLKQYLTATTQESIVDSIVEGFRNGKRAASDFANDFGLMMQNALVNSLKAKLLNGDMDAFYKKFSDYALSDGQLTAGEMADLQKDYNDIIEKGVKEFDAIKQITGIDIGSKSKDPLAGAIQGMSAETAGLLAGQFNAIRITNADISQSMRSMLIYQANISKNSDYLKKLDSIDDSLRALNNNTNNSVRGYGLG